MLSGIEAADLLHPLGAHWVPLNKGRRWPTIHAGVAALTDLLRAGEAHTSTPSDFYQSAADQSLPDGETATRLGERLLHVGGRPHSYEFGTTCS